MGVLVIVYTEMKLGWISSGVFLNVNHWVKEIYEILADKQDNIQLGYDLT